MTNVLTNDVHIIHGASTEGLATILEATFAFFLGVALASAYCWQLAVVALLYAPFIMVAAGMAGAV
jgi:hypothetical protein